MPRFFVKNAEELISEEEIRHFSLEKRAEVLSRGWLPDQRPLDIALTCGASCPDAEVDGVLLRTLSFFDDTYTVNDVLSVYPPVEN